MPSRRFRSSAEAARRNGGNPHHPTAGTRPWWPGDASGQPETPATVGRRRGARCSSQVPAGSSASIDTRMVPPRGLRSFAEAKRRGATAAALARSRWRGQRPRWVTGWSSRNTVRGARHRATSTRASGAAGLMTEGGHRRAAGRPANGHREAGAPSVAPGTERPERRTHSAGSKTHSAGSNQKPSTLGMPSISGSAPEARPGQPGGPVSGPWNHASEGPGFRGLEKPGSAGSGRLRKQGAPAVNASERGKAAAPTRAAGGAAAVVGAASGRSRGSGGGTVTAVSAAPHRWRRRRPRG